MNLRKVAGWLCMLGCCGVWAGSGQADESGPVPAKKAGILPLIPPTITATNPVVLATGLTNLALGATVEVSSTSTGAAGEGLSQNLVDGDLTTRWSSAYRVPQCVIVDFKRPVTVRGVRLHWEQASATCYSIAAATQTNTWKHVHFHFKSEKEPRARVDTIALRGDISTSRLKFDLQRNVNPEWGFSLYEIEVLGPSSAP